MSASGRLELAPLEERLALFAEGIAGRYFHIRPGSEFAGRSLALGDDVSALTHDTVYLPETLDAPDGAAYRVLTLQQLCHRQFGSYTFRFADAMAHLPDRPVRELPDLGGRASDLERFYRQYQHPALISRLFRLCERIRVDTLMRRHYPGIGRHLERYHRHLLQRHPPEPVTTLGEALHALECQSRGLRTEVIVAMDLSGALAPACAALNALTGDPGDVYRAAAAADAAYRSLSALIVMRDGPGQLPLQEEFSDPATWMQREARLEDWRDDLAAMEAALSVEMLDGDEVEAASGELGDGELRPDDVDIRALANDRDTLARRIDMERSALRDAMGASQAHSRSFRYDEWDYLAHRYRSRYCRLFEQRQEPDHERDLASFQAVIREHRAGVQRRLEQIKPLGYQRVFRVADGDELDFNAVIQARQDIRVGLSPDERVYSRRDRVHRDVCAAFLVDLSASTDDPLEPPPPAPPDEDDPFLWGRSAPAAALANTEPEHEPRRIIDVQRDAMLVMSAALENLGDSYGVYGFSGYGHDCVEVFVAKEPDEPFGRNTLAAIAGMKPRRSTRMGPAIRHAVRKLVDSGNALKVLLILSDGFPQDCDYGPERGDHEYGVQDTAKALQEAAAKGVETFCVTVDRSGHDYLKRMCPDARYLVIEEIEDLPEQLSKVYEALTA